MKKMEKKTKLIIAIAIIIFVFVILPTSSYLLAKLNILLKGDIAISLDPQQKTIYARTGQSEDIQFNTTIENRGFCEASCNFRFKDLGKNKTVDEGTFIGKKGTVLLKKYLMTSPPKGTGQLAYEFKVDCRNEPTLLCPVQSSDVRTRSSFVTLNYELSEEGKLVEASIRKRLISLLGNLISLDVKMQEFAGKASIIGEYFYLDEMINETKAASQEVNDLVKASDDLKEKWKDEEYASLDTAIGEVESKSNNTNTTLADLDIKLGNLLEDKRKARDRITTIKDKFALIDEMNQAYALLGRNASPTEAMIEEYIMIIAKFNRGGYEDNIEAGSDVFFLNKLIDAEYNLLEPGIIEAAEEGLAIDEESNTTIEKPGNMSEALDAIMQACSKAEKTLNSTANPDANTSVNATIASNVSSEYYTKYCNKTVPAIINRTREEFIIRFPPENITITATPRITQDIAAHLQICCIFGECKECCTTTDCAKDNYPVILLHGHAFAEDAIIEYSLAGFGKIISELSGDGFIDVGTLLPGEAFTEERRGVYGRFGKPIIFGTTYYLNVFDKEGEVIAEPSKSESIRTYATRLNQTVELVKFLTRAEKVNIIGFSMGGLVAREYMRKYGDESIEKLITIGTPNKGILGRVESFCPITGSSIECQEMASTSNFMNELNNPKNNPKNAKVYAIAGKGCDMDGKTGDGVVVLENQVLPYALNFEIEGKCQGDQLLHETIRDITLYPKVYETIKNALKN